MQDLEDFNDFNDEHQGWLEKQDLDHDKLYRKMRLLTFASLAAATPSREVPYASIVKALRITEDEVEMWTIDTIRAGLVEGKLSQQRKVFLVHKVYWMTSLGRVLDQLMQGRVDAKAQQERDAQEVEKKLTQASFGGQQGGRRHQGKQQKERSENAD